MKHLFFLYGVFLLCGQDRVGGQTVVPPAELRFPVSVKDPAPLIFEHITDRDGLPAGINRPLLRDSKGYLWLQNSSLGLLRYDGYTFQVFRDTADKAFDGRVAPTRIIEDSDGTYWLNGAAGLKSLDPKTLTFKTHTDQSGLKKNISAIFRDRENKLWVAVDKQGLFLLDRGTGTLIPFHADSIYDAGSGAVIRLDKPLSVNHIDQDADGGLWIMADSDPKSGLFQVDEKRRRVVYHPLIWKGHTGQAHNGIVSATDMFIQQNSPYIWIGSWAYTGLLRFDRRTGQCRQYLLDYQPGRALLANVVLFIRQKDERTLWVSTEAGVFLFDVIDERLAPYKHRPDDISALPSASGYFSVVDHEGISWFYTHPLDQSLTKFVAGHQSLRRANPVSDPIEVPAIWKDARTQDVYYALNIPGSCVRALLYQVRGTNGTKTVRPGPWPCGNGFITSLLGDPSGRFIWCLTNMGLFKIDRENLNLTPVKAEAANEPGFRIDRVYFSSAAVNSRGEVWFTSRYEGFFRYDPATRQFFRYRFRHDTMETFPQLRALQVDRKDRVWLGYRYIGGIVRYDPASGSFTWFLNKSTGRRAVPGIQIYDLTETPDGRTWVACDRDFYCIDAFDNVQRVKALSGVDPRRVVADRHGNLWITTYTKKLLRYSTITGAIKEFDRQNGFFMDDLNDCLYIAPDHEIFFSDQYRFRLEDLKTDTTPPPVVFCQFRIFERDTFFGRDLNYLDRATLRHDQNFFTISFAALALANPARNTYAYRLDGVDADWVYSGTRREASYTNLAPGRYTFRVRGANEDGVWCRAPIALQIVILPAWYQTWWFKTAVALAMMAVLTAFYREHLARVRARAEARQKEAELQRVQAEFRQRLAETEMTALRAQMNPHFLFNVMNSINRYLLEHDAEQASLYLTKFSRLIRLVLENSRSELVTLENELEALRLYIEMETLRFKHKVQYAMNVDPEIDLRFTRIPPLLLQPYVENAIWHGLLHKEDGGTVTVRVRQPEENRLEVEIADDGIGRAAAARLRSKSAQRHKSFGMQVTRERVALINELYRTHTEIEIHDLVHADGSAAGTLVKLEIPV